MQFCYNVKIVYDFYFLFVYNPLYQNINWNKPWCEKHCMSNSLLGLCSQWKCANKNSQQIKTKSMREDALKEHKASGYAWLLWFLLSFASWQQLLTFHCLCGRSEAVSHCTATFTPLKRCFVYMSLGSVQMGQIQKPLSNTYAWYRYTHWRKWNSYTGLSMDA